VGKTFGGPGNALINQLQSFSPGSTGYAGGTTTAYDQNNTASNDTFRINGGANQTFDSSVIYNATITYIDCSTANITAVVFQDTAGKTYLAPEFSANADQTALEALPLRSITLNSFPTGTYAGLTGTRQPGNYAVCFTKGMRISTRKGMRPVERLKAGDWVVTRDHGLQIILWIGKSERVARDGLVPVRILKGALGGGLPKRDLIVLQQHRMLLTSRLARMKFLCLRRTWLDCRESNWSIKAKR
jgi:hypothetical protein